MDLSAHPLWSVIVLAGAVIAVGLQLKLTRGRGALALAPLLLAAAVGGAVADRMSDFLAQAATGIVPSALRSM